MNSETQQTDQIALVKLNKDLKALASGMTQNEARHLVDAYYIIQEQRLRFGGQIRSMTEEPHELLGWAEKNSATQERWIATALGCYAQSEHMGQWAMKVQGIGPIIAVGLLAYIDLEPWVCAEAKADRIEKGCTPEKPCGPQCKRVRIETVGHIYSFAGLNPEAKWEKGQKRPWNAALKQVCFHLGESFIKVKGNPVSVYGRLYDQRKAYEQVKNEKGDYAEQAAAILKARPTHAQKAIYKTGKLPPGQLHSRARRYAVKIFLSHWFHEAYVTKWGKEPPAPFPIGIMGHVDEIKPEVPYTKI